MNKDMDYDFRFDFYVLFRVSVTQLFTFINYIIVLYHISYYLSSEGLPVWY